MSSNPSPTPLPQERQDCPLNYLYLTQYWKFKPEQLGRKGGREGGRKEGRKEERREGRKKGKKEERREGRKGEKERKRGE
jgi:hypothetical protein